MRPSEGRKTQIEYKGNEFFDQDSGTEWNVEWWNVAISKIRHNRPAQL